MLTVAQLKIISKVWFLGYCGVIFETSFQVRWREIPTFGYRHRSTATLSNNLLVDERPEELNDYLSIFTERADPRPTFIPANEEEEEEEEEEEDEGKGFDISRALIRSDDGAFPWCGALATSRGMYAIAHTGIR